MDDQLDRRRGKHAGQAVDQEQGGRVPGADRSGQEQHAPGQRRQQQQRLGGLDEPAAVEAIGQRPGVDREEQVGYPVAEDREAGQGRRVERLEDDPVADDVLDALGRHADERYDEVAPVVAVVERAELRHGPSRRARSIRGDQPFTAPAASPWTTKRWPMK
jgi:hypothetical protein